MAESAEGARLLSECRVKSSTEGSNPSLSARLLYKLAGPPFLHDHLKIKRPINDDRPQGVSRTVLRVKSMLDNFIYKGIDEFIGNSLRINLIIPGINLRL